MKLLVIGCNGFIGGHVLAGLSPHFDASGADIMASDEPRYFRIDPESPDFAALVERSGAEVIVNCSGAASVPASFEAPYRDFTLNTVRIAQLLEAIRASKRDVRLVHISSAAIYGNPGRAPVVESQPAAPVSPYGWHKWQAESLCREYSQIYGVATVSLRIFSAYGPGLRKQLFWDMFQKSLRGPDVELFGTGSEARDFIYVADVVDAIRHVIQGAVFDGRAINVGSGRAVTIREAAATFFAELGNGCNANFSGDERLGDPDFWQANIDQLRSLGFAPKFDLNSGLNRVAKWIVG
jgi:dTDP-glucose 4,6-dehydratase/UDP-glucose 4-epimerase